MLCIDEILRMLRLRVCLLWFCSSFAADPPFEIFFLTALLCHHS